MAEDSFLDKGGVSYTAFVFHNVYCLECNWECVGFKYDAYLFFRVELTQVGLDICSLKKFGASNLALSRPELSICKCCACEV